MPAESTLNNSFWRSFTTEIINLKIHITESMNKVLGVLVLAFIGSMKVETNCNLEYIKEVSIRRVGGDYILYNNVLLIDLMCC